MKRLFILSAAVAALASCSNSEVITEVNEPQVLDKAIAFETFSSNATREDAENSGQTSTDKLEVHHETFKVWGYKDVQTDYVFNGVTVSYTDPTAEVQSGSWNYSPIHFWDKNANSYEFYACAPATTSDATSSFTLNRQATSSATQANDYFTLSEVTLKNVTSSKAEYVQSLKDNQVSNSVTESGVTNSTSITYGETGANTDYMIANACKVENTYFGDPVQLHFNHILSRLNITVKKGATLSNTANATLNVVSLEVKNMAAKGSFNENTLVTSLPEGSTKRWTVTKDDTKVTYVANALQDVTDDEKYILQSLVLPQEVEYEKISLDGKVGDDGAKISTATQPYMKIVYTIETTDSQSTTTNSETYTAYYNLAAVFSANSTTKVAFNEGWQNTLHITIDATKITFDPDVYQWKENDNKTGSLEIGGTNSTQNP